MPIDTISQVISTIPEAGRRGVDVQTQFVIKQEDFQDHLQGTTVTELNALKTQINTTVTGMNTAVDTVNTKASEASASASSASTSANTATTKASEASASASSASTSATKAGQWADNDYNVPVEVGKYSAKHWSVVTQNTLSSKLDTSAYTASDVLTKLKTVDGTGSGLDADLLDGVDSSSFFRRDTQNTVMDGPIMYGQGGKEIIWSSQSLDRLSIGYGYTTVLIQDNKAWHAGNDGIGSGLDADLLDGLDSTEFMRKNQVGYASNAWGLVVQDTNKTTAVTLNKLSGRITLSNSQLLSGELAAFRLFNSQINQQDTINPELNDISGGIGTNYTCWVTNKVDGGAWLVIKNISNVSLSDPISIDFTIIKGAITW